MRAALIEELGRPPSAGEAPEPEAEGGEVLEVLAAPINPIDVAVGSGRFYGGHPPLPYVPGAEAIARTADGRVVWTYSGGLGVARAGGMAERVRAGSVVADVPGGADPAVAGALGIAGMAGWMPVAWRSPVRPGETVLVLGATGTSGLVALQGAKLLGAGRVVGAGRSEAGLERARECGADAVVDIDAVDDLAGAFREACGGDGPTLVVDPLWGEPVAAAAEAAARGARIVQYGQSAGTTAPITSAAVRSKMLEILGYSNFAVPEDVLASEFARVVRHAMAGDLRVDVERVPLDGISEAWARMAAGEAAAKIVVVP